MKVLGLTASGFHQFSRVWKPQKNINITSRSKIATEIMARMRYFAVALNHNIEHQIYATYHSQEELGTGLRPPLPWRGQPALHTLNEVIVDTKRPLEVCFIKKWSFKFATLFKGMVVQFSWLILGHTFLKRKEHK